MSKADDASAAARRKANEMLTRKQDTERVDARDKQRQAEDAKIAKLKALRLAKEAADKAARAAAPPGPADAPRPARALDEGHRQYRLHAGGGAGVFRPAGRAADAGLADEGPRGPPAQEHPGDGPRDHVQDLAARHAEEHRADAGDV